MKETSPIQKLSKTSNSLRTVIPRKIVKQMELHAGDIIIWEYGENDKEIKLGFLKN